MDPYIAHIENEKRRQQKQEERRRELENERQLPLGPEDYYGWTDEVVTQESNDDEEYY